MSRKSGLQEDVEAFTAKEQLSFLEFFVYSPAAVPYIL
jgi:hypothetical protein